MKKIYEILKIPMLKISNKNKGFTLIEIIIAFTLFAIMMGGIYGIVISAMNINKAGEVKQKAALYGQKILEDIKSKDVRKGEDGSLNISDEIVLSKNPNDSKYSWTGYLDKNNKYYTKIEINKNSSIILNNDEKEDNNSDGEESEEKLIKTFDFNIDLDGDTSPIRIKSNNIENGKLEYDINSNEDLKLIINTKTKNNEKILVIKDRDNNEILTDKNYIKKEEDKDNEIRLNFNFSEYKAKSKLDNDKYKKVEIDVFNQDNVPLNIILKKSEKLNVGVNNKLGNIKVYDNRSENNEVLKNGQLYDIKIEISKSPTDTTPVFTGYSSQNINIE
ncbi:prepilin-type N-terminal cleavage/methylation domain-containing protein [Clostridium botulinum]|uniref:PulJ/GspJ family protein n=1 Tax=Clostridium botulinum TaxID=1491 RepID=UPI0013FFD44E|nr:prepilin-type N-terminal cleavage/methylation domain-containing protein [Clostridium botulinum]MBY6837660.1 prepilin-type N-terminal cleavage/methylation domain-containing protein [Clostridium botulinum]NFG65574.1 prepilin-type N-terminal cleavage/methylation domain-containing protein [Clostridium botulinum]NFQ24258.1 prepilin-type N-terminal cleavage/methylation domain-containing protein [Clostridium botulinum]